MSKIAQFIMRRIGWKFVGELSQEKKWILIVAPHTSNWDFFLGLIAEWSLGIRCSFVAKHQLFFFPLGMILRSLGGIAINRGKSNNFVDEAVALFKEKEELILAMTPEGTRAPVLRWKTGFYHIASKAGVPIMMVGFDYKTKSIVLSRFEPTGDMHQDFKEIFKFYRGIEGLYPKKIPEVQ